jgi:hypothetical protein
MTTAQWGGGAPDAREAVARLRAELERLADALAEPRLDGILEQETAIEAAVHAVPYEQHGAPRSPDEPHDLSDEIARTRAALLRCRRLGASLADVVRIGIQAQGHQPGYGPRPIEPTFAGATLNAKG